MVVEATDAIDKCWGLPMPWPTDGERRRGGTTTMDPLAPSHDAIVAALQNLSALSHPQPHRSQPTNWHPDAVLVVVNMPFA